MYKKFLLYLLVIASIGSTQAQPANPSKDWSIGLQLWTFRVFSFYDAVAKADSCGIKAIQAFPGQPLGNGLKGGFGPEMTAADRTAVKEYVKSKGMHFVAFGVTNAGNEEGWKKLFEFAKEMGIPLIVAEPQDSQWNYIDRLAGEYKIPVAIHDHPRPSHYWNPDKVIEAMTGHPNLGVCADVGHWARSGLDPVECLKKLNGRIWNVHVKDITTFNKTNADDAIPGHGVLDFPAIFQELKNQGYKGNFSIEHEANWNNNAGDVVEIVKFYNDKVKNLK